MFQAGGVIRKLLKWRLDIYLFQIASEEEFHSVLNKSEPEKKEKISVCTSSKNNNASHFSEEKIFHKMQSASGPSCHFLFV